MRALNRLFFTLAILTGAADVSAQDSYPFRAETWRIEGDARLETLADGDTALRVSSGAAYLNDVEFRDGTIEFDVFVSGDRAFVYLMFRGQSDEEYDDLYFRPHKSGLPDAIQYAPVFQRRSAWQLYHGEHGTAAASFDANSWTHVKLQISGTTATVWVGERNGPNITISKLGRDAAAGWLAVRGFVPRNSAAEYAAKFRNFRVTKSDAAPVVDDPNQALREGQLISWQVSPPFDAPSGPVLEQLPETIMSSDWSTPPIQPSGVFEFLRSHRIPGGSRHWAVAAETTLRADADKICRLHLGYSDEITLFLNGEPIAYQDSSYRFDELRQDGVMHGDQLLVFLHLIRGDNRLRAIIADRFGGWGLSARLDTCDGVSEL